MKREVTHPPKVALCRVCHGTGRVPGDEKARHTSAASVKGAAG